MEIPNALTINYPMKITPEQYWSIQHSMLTRLSWILEIPDELRTKIVLCMTPIPGYFTEEEMGRYMAQAEGSRNEAMADLAVWREKLTEINKELGEL